MAGIKTLVVGLLWLAVLTPLVAAEKRPTIAELTNFSFSPELAQWLVGPVSRIASSQEIQEYLELEDEASAVLFINRFWQRRETQESMWPDQLPRAIFERRAEEADRLFTEGVHLGHRTDRGEIHVLYGPPEEIEFESDSDRRVGPVEIWKYGKKADEGLDGRKPKSFYRFAKIGELTVFYGSLRSRTGSLR